MPTFPPLIAGPEELLREALGTLGAASLDTLVAFHALCCAVVAQAYVDVWDLGADAQVGWLFAHQIALVKDRNGFAVLMYNVVCFGQWHSRYSVKLLLATLQRIAYAPAFARPKTCTASIATSLDAGDGGGSQRLPDFPRRPGGAGAART